MSVVGDLARSFLKRVKTTGNENLMAICPFHRKPDGSEEQNPSFSINTLNGLWFCHSCHTRGNFYTFLRSLGISHTEITRDYQYVLDEASQHVPAAPNPYNLVEPTEEPLHESILGLFDYYPDLMRDWGFPPDLCQMFGVGFDERHMRVTFPLRDLSGRLVGISGRSVNGEGKRYKVYDKEYLDFGLPERKTEKRALVWNAHEAVVALALEPDPLARRLVLVEGFKAAMRVAQSGISAVVALLGSYMTTEQWYFIEHTGTSVCLMFDNNPAGRSGTFESAKRLLTSTRELRFVEYNAEQPSDLTPEEVLAAVAAAPLFSSWYQRLTPPIFTY